MKGRAEKAMNEICSLIEELEQFDNPAGYMMKYEEVKKRLDPAMQKIIQFGEDSLDHLHALLLHEETWSCLFALQILGEIRSVKSVPYLVSFIRRNEKGDYWEGCEDAMLALRAIGEPAVEQLLRELKSDFEKKNHFAFLVGSLTGIEDERVFSWMIQTVQDYINNPEKYAGWFDIQSFTFDFDVHGKKEALPLLYKLLEMELPEMEKREIRDTIRAIEEPEKFQEELKNYAKLLKVEIGTKKISGNDPCPCGSGKKYKKCCWLKEIGARG
jgi:hypothetical protein